MAASLQTHPSCDRRLNLRLKFLCEQFATAAQLAHIFGFVDLNEEVLLHACNGDDRIVD